MPATETATPTAIAASAPACPRGEGIVENGSFDSDTSHWERPYGSLVHTTSEFHSGPGSAQLVTSHASDSLEHLGTFGQCIDLSGQLDGWQESDGAKHMTVEAYLKTDEGIVSATLNGIFLSQSRCRGEHVGRLHPPAVSGDEGWTRVSGTIAIPEAAKSFHVFVWATGVDDSGTAHVDDVQACSSRPATVVATPPPSVATAIPPTATPGALTATPGALTATPRPATHTVCGAGCDFTTIQAAVDNPATTDGAILEVTDAVHSEAGIVVSKDVTIRGLGVASTTVQAHETPEEAPERVFLIEEGANVVLERMTIRHGRPSVQRECGGGILTWGTLTLRDSMVTENTANGGGGICSRGPAKLTVINSTVTGNIADGIAEHSFKCGSGGGITSGGESLRLINTTVSGNQAGIEKVTSDPRPRSLGGGVHIGCSCTAVFTNSTISGNKAFRDGGGVSLHGSLRLVNCTISNNTAAGLGGGIYVRGPLDYVNTIIAKNAGREGDCVLDSTFMGTGSVSRNNHNLVEDKTCDPDYWGDPMLGPLTDNGGDVLTHALLPGSPAIDAVPAISCTVPNDQRGEPRPMAHMSADTPCDIGAFELQPGE